MIIGMLPLTLVPEPTANSILILGGGPLIFSLTRAADAGSRICHNQLAVSSHRAIFWPKSSVQLPPGKLFHHTSILPVGAAAGSDSDLPGRHPAEKLAATPADVLTLSQRSNPRRERAGLASVPAICSRPPA